MSKILIVPDIHGRDFWRVIKKYDLYYIDKIIFLGDYLDPYPQEYPDLNKEELYQKTYKNLIDIISLKKDNINKVVLLLENHEWSYLNEDYRCSRFDEKHYIDFHNILCDNKNLFKICHIEKNYLFIHSGISKEWLEFIGYDDKKYPSIEKYLNEEIEIPKLLMCGPSRYGPDFLSGPLWLDEREILDIFNTFLFDKYYQVFGHTKKNTAVIKKNYACLDTQQCFLLDTEIKEFSIFE